MHLSLHRVTPDLAFIAGGLAVALGFGSSIITCFGWCGAGLLPLADVVLLWFLLGVELIAFSLWVILRREIGMSRINGEISILVAIALVVVAAYIPLSQQFALPSYSDMGLYGTLLLVLIFESVVLVWVGSLRLVQRKLKRRTEFLATSSPYHKRGPGRRILTAGTLAPAILLLFLFYPISCGFVGCSSLGMTVITLESATCQSSPAFSGCYFALNNPGSSTLLTQARLGEAQAGNTIIVSPLENLTPGIMISANGITNATVQFPSNVPINSTISYILQFSNGDSISGLIVSQ